MVQGQLTKLLELAQRMAEATARLLLEAGTEPLVFVRLNMTGAAQHNQALLEKWRPHNIHL